MGKTLTLVAVLALAAACLAQDPPALPEGLDEPTATTAPAGGPALPAGLDDGGGPSLPAGLGDEGPSLPEGLEGQAERTRAEDREPDEPAAGENLVDWLNLTGFWEVRGGVRTQHDRHQKQASLGETRLQLDATPVWEELVFELTADFVYDAVTDQHRVDCQRGRGWVDLRRANVAFSPLEFMDVKAGRQVLTWGTGDLIFLNDLFPKDWRSFFIGRDVEYLKAPSDAVRIGLFGDLANLDFVYVPLFDPDRFLTGRRISFWNSRLGRRSGRDAVIDPAEPNDWFDDAEYHGRLSRRLGSYELAGYGYWGYWKSPAGQDPVSGKATFPRLSVYGGSVRGPLAEGIANAEFAYYDSRQDRDGDDPFVRNSEMRYLFGYEQDLPDVAEDLTVGAQYYIEQMIDHGAYRRSLPPGTREADACRHVVTLRVTKLLANQNLELSLFGYYSPSDEDAYLRPRVSYKIDDHWTVAFGGNVFFGADSHTFFGQLDSNTNVYASLRYGF
jgi:hypothetical protein